MTLGINNIAAAAAYLGTPGFICAVRDAGWPLVVKRYARVVLWTLYSPFGRQQDVSSI